MNNLLLFVGLFLLFGYCSCITPSFKVDYNATLIPIDEYNGCQKFLLSSDGYKVPFYIANLTGSHYEIGVCIGYFFNEAFTENYNAILGTLVPLWYERDVLELFLDWQWRDYLSIEFPQEYSQEIQGIYVGSSIFGYNIPKNLVERGLVLSSFPGDAVSNIEYLLKNEMETIEFKKFIKLNHGEKVLLSIQSSIDRIKRSFNPNVIKGMQCSHFSVFGERTLNGNMYNGRNLDWFIDTGIAQYKLVYIFHPEGAYSHVAVGFAGLMGAITGISSNGIFVAESDNDSKKVTFKGLTWSIRLRYVMENAATIDEAIAVWNSTNNTMGMNHMLSSANEVTSNPHPAYALETMSGYTAFFPDNSSNEHFFYSEQTGNNSTIQIQMGYPIPQAVYRTNHGYDSVIRENQCYQVTPEDNSFTRYMLFYENFNYYEQQGSNFISTIEAINITSILGDKNNTDYYDCVNQDLGGNVISATFIHSINEMYLAFEEGSGVDRICACCGTYVKIDLSPFWTLNSGKNIKQPKISKNNNNFKSSTI